MKGHKLRGENIAFFYIKTACLENIRRLAAKWVKRREEKRREEKRREEKRREKKRREEKRREEHRREE